MRVENISMRYGDREVLRNFSYEFPQSGVIALMGPSGCGKTTLLRIIAGLEKSQTGAICLTQGERISMVFQEDRLVSGLTILENILLVMSDLKSMQNRERALEYLMRCGLSHEEGRYPAQLSGGMRRRVAIARAMAFDGGVLILDEPFKGLDDKVKRMVMDFVFSDTFRSKRLAIMVTHDSSEAAAADKILQLDGPPLRIIDE